jgi:hypothetical protein
VIALAGAPATELQRRWAIRLSLGAGMAISHQWAGRLAGLPAIHDDIWSVTVPTADHRRRAGFIVHQQRLAPEDVTEVDGFAVTSVPRTLCDLATVSSKVRLQTMVEAAAFDLGWTFDSMWQALLRTGTKGRPGASNLSSVLEKHRPGKDVARTKLEAALDDVLALTGLPIALAQHPLPGSGRRSGLVDRVLPAAKLIVEADGRRWHARTAAMVADRERDIEAGRRGWFTMRVMHEQLVGDPVDIATAIVETYQLRVAA